MISKQHRINRNIATFYLVLMLVQLVYIEGYTISPIKVVAMSVAPLIWLARCAYFSKAVIFGGLYWLSCFLAAYLHPGFRFSTIAYSGMFVMTFIMYYNLVYKGAFTLEYFIKLVRWMILAYAGCLVLQQCCILVGIRFMPLINLNNQFFLSITKLPSFSLEPSHSARILGVLFYAYFKCNQYARGSVIPFKQWFKGEHKWVTIGFLWAMLTMGSGTAYVVLAILSLLFLRRKYMAAAIPFVAVIFFAMPHLENENMNRATSVAQATMTGDAQNVLEADGSAAVRVLPWINTIKYLDLSTMEGWFGHGADSGLREGLYSKRRMIGAIYDYGFLSYVMSLLLVFFTMMNFFSLPTIMFFMGVGGTMGNIAYGWGSLMVFLTVLYFSKHNRSNV